MESPSKLNLVLASNSPRRKELLGWIDVPFTVLGSNIEEFSNEKDPVAFAKNIAVQKGNCVWETIEKSGEIENPLIVSSDTLVELNDKIYGKPESKEEARAMLLELSGKWHRVVTSIFLKAVVKGKLKERVFAIETRVKFNDITEDLMVPYLESGESMDKAGAYGIQGKGLVFVESLEGSYSNVVGFPLVEFLSELKSFLEDSSVNWRENFKC